MAYYDYTDFTEMLKNMKPMEYKDLKMGQRIKDILLEGLYKGYHFIIVSYGTHPCAYVEIPQDHPYFEREDVDLPVHGGVTWAEPFSPALQDQLIPGEYHWFLGWDYNHLGDYSTFSMLTLFGEDLKQWTTWEIFRDDVCPAIEALIDAKKKHVLRR